MKVYITKYALTKGIIEKEVKEIGDGIIRTEDFEFYHGEGREWHKTEESAIAKAEEMRRKK